MSEDGHLPGIGVLPAKQEPARPPPAGRTRRGSVSSESVTPAQIDLSAIPVIEKSEEAMVRIQEAVSSNILFVSLDKPSMDAIAGAMMEVEVAAEEYLIKQGDEGNHFYIVDTGHFDCFVHKKGGTPPGDKVLDYTSGQFFGELALMYNQPRAASVKATEDSIVWSVDRETFRMFILSAASQMGVGNYE